jgi:hypothetical protein
MSNPESDARWQQIAAARAELDQVVVPLHGRDGRPRKVSDRALRFAEALAFSDHWSPISDARRRGTDLAA